MSSKRYDEASGGYRVEITATSTKERCTIIGALFGKEGQLLPAGELVEFKGPCTREHLEQGVIALENRIKKGRLDNPSVVKALRGLKLKVRHIKTLP